MGIKGLAAMLTLKLTGLVFLLNRFLLFHKQTHLHDSLCSLCLPHIGSDIDLGRLVAILIEVDLNYTGGL